MRSLKILIPTTTFAAAMAALVACSTKSDNSGRTASEKSLQTVEPGNPTCAQLGLGTTETKLEPVENGTFSLNGGSVTISNSDGTTFNFTSTVGIDAVIVKGGPSANVYTFNPEATSGTGLHAPDNASRGPAGLSHITFCFDEDADAGVDAGEDAGVDAGEDAGVDAGEDAVVDAGEDGGVSSSSGGSSTSSTSSSGGGRTW